MLVYTLNAMRFLLFILFCCCLVETTSCVSVYADNAQAALLHPEETPAYIIPAGLTAEEKRWFITFQEGTLLVTGWQDIVQEILAKTPAEQREDQRAFLGGLGRKIGQEWCKGNATRKVSTDMLRAWGKEIKEAVRHAPVELPALLVRIDQQVNLLIN
ncbi:MAG: hypothetical protein CSA32_03805 [Desulfobulbus propionicus]|nr:MAG: hypothetical protein CSA32_03805 [Desulfobulbus propionicus]